MIKLGKALSLVLCAILFFSSPSRSQSKIDKTVVGTVGKEKITYGEVKQNMLSGAVENPSLTEMEDFLPIYLEYKAKIQFAKKEGILDDPELLSELNLYAKQASYSHWLDNRIKETEFDKYFKRASTELKSEHILISVPQNAPPADTIAAYTKLIEARNKFLNGSSITELDTEYSSQQNGRSMGGDLPWFSIGTTVKEFEDVIFSLEVGEISMPFRSQFGYHIVHLQDSRPRTLSRQVSHIFTRANAPQSKSKIDEAYSALENDSAWASVVTKFSDDNLSAQNGGNIGWVNYGRYQTSFVDSVMDVNPELEFSKPILTGYGYHIFKIDSVQTFSSELERKESYMKEFLDSPNFKKSNSFVVNWLKNEFTSDLNTSVVSKYKGYLSSKDTTRINKISSPSFSNETVYRFNNNSYSVSKLHDYLKENHSNASANSVTDTWIDDFVTFIIDSQIIEITTSEFPDFQKVLDNYKKGLAVYQVNDQYLWSAATVDTSKLQQIYEQNTAEYSFPARYYYHLLSARADSSLDKAVDFIQNGESPDSVRTYYPKVAVNKDSTGVFTDDPYDRLSKLQPQSFSERFEYKNRKALFYLNEILPARKMTFDEAFNRLLAKYQPERERLWITDLEKEFKIKADIKKLRSAFKKDNSL